ncbi:urea transporter [Paraburkholderia sp. J12]|uniref:urea transporter n=1 Tax=Paraburkholderia sp. J12 TaxID=2805432 RepID=UPI002ABE7201|nr:urea transporter [Paraburkholderia sp. J12]
MSIHAQARGDGAALRTVLRSVGQIVLQRHAGTGACLVAALALCDLRLACAALLGATVANVCAVLAGHADNAIRDGLAGFNGALAALAAFTLIGDTPTATAVALLAATASAWIGAALAPRLARAGLSVYSTPCLIASWVWLALRAGASAHGPMPAPTHALTALTTLIDPDWAAAPQTAWFGLRALAGILSGVAQTEFASGAPAGLLVVTGLALSSRRAAAFALLGAALASGLELACGTPLSYFDAGLTGFNGALAALATLALGTRTAICATMLAAALHLAAAHYGLPAMTAPFVLASWCAHGTARMLGGRPRNTAEARAAKYEPQETQTPPRAGATPTAIR